MSCNQASSNRHKQPMGDLHVEPEGGRAYWAVGRPPAGPTDLPLLACGSLPGPTCQWNEVYLLSCRFLALVGPILHILTRVAS